MELTPEQVRVLGCLVEKEATTPDLYPLSTNALVAACNQRSSRDPVVAYDEATVTQTMLSLRERGLARTSRGEGSRVYKHAHGLREALGVDGAALAVLSVLMLRGAQTPGELRTRTERQHEFPSLEAVEATLQALARREEPLVAVLERLPGHKESRWMHLLAGEEGLAAAAAAIPVRSSAPAAGPGLAAEVAELREELAALRERVELLESLLDA
ncbi:MAG: YceH family protein [Thermoleophilia bacterium]